MASQNLVSGVLTDETLNTALAGIQSLTESMDFLISLSPDERRRITKLKGGHVDFVREIRDVCNQKKKGSGTFEKGFNIVIDEV